MKNEWSKMTWSEIREASQRKPVVIVPIGCVETQGPYTPVGMEQILADRLARDVAECTDSLALPTIPFGHSDAFMNIPGTIFVRPEVLTGLYQDVLTSVVRAGFEHILCFAYHIPNEPYIEQAARRVRAETGISVAWVNPGALAATYLGELLDDPVAARGHGAEPGLSLMRYICGSEVPSEPTPGDAPRSYAGMDVRGPSLTFQGFPIGMPVFWEELYPTTGGFGDVSLGGPELGEQIYSRLAAHLSALANQFAKTDTQSPTSDFKQSPVAAPLQETE